jgi:predicted ester cyclase
MKEGKMNSFRKTGLVLTFGILLAIATGLFAGSAAAQGEEPTCEGDYLESVREVGTAYIDALNSLDLAPWYALLTDDYMRYGTGDFIPMDKPAALADAQGIMAVFPGFQTEIHMSSVSTDCRYVTFIWTSTGTNDGPIGEIPPTGVTGSVSGISVTEVADGQIVAEWISFDQLTLFGKLGLVAIGPPVPES